MSYAQCADINTDFLRNALRQCFNSNFSRDEFHNAAKIFNAIAVAVEEEKPVETSTEAVQPEVISKGKKDKEGEEGAVAATPATGGAVKK